MARRDKLPVGRPGRRAAPLLLVAVLAAGLLVWQSADPTPAQTTEEVTVNDETTVVGVPGDRNAPGTGEPGGRTNATGPVGPPQVIASTGVAVPQGTDISWEELQRLKSGDASKPTPHDTAQTDPAGG